jgi:hypothetical protein
MARECRAKNAPGRRTLWRDAKKSSFILEFARSAHAARSSNAIFLMSLYPDLILAGAWHFSEKASNKSVNR